MIRKLSAFFNPEQFRGWGKKRNYFEGWYFKSVSGDGKTALAVIPGIAMDDSGNRQAFIQVLDGKNHTSRYHNFPFQDFIPAPRRFHIEINKNLFSEKQIRLDLPGLRGELRFSGNVPWPKPWYSPGIMGPYSFAPFMECYHGIVSMDHGIEGELEINGNKVSFSGGRGYIEKDWGRSFPAAYIWAQSNHFEEPGISFKASVAKIPWLRGSFTGFIAGLWLRDRLYRFTTYNGTKLRRSFADEKNAEISMENGRYRLDMLAFRDKATALASPIRGFMDGRIEESMTSEIEILLTDKKSKTIVFNGRGRHAGLEVAGKTEEIFVL